MGADDAEEEIARMARLLNEYYRRLDIAEPTEAILWAAAALQKEADKTGQALVFEWSEED